MNEGEDKIKEILRDRFTDDEVPANHLSFDEVMRATQKSPSLFSRWNIYKIAASVAILMVVGSLFYILQKNHTKPKNIQTLVENDIINNRSESQNQEDLKLQKTNVVKNNKQLVDTKKIEKKLKKSVRIATIDTVTKKENELTISSKEYKSVDSEQSFHLPDSSLIVLQKNGRLTYDSQNTNFRKVLLTGTSFFEVAKNKNRPFQIFGKYSVVTVTGTAFIMSVENGKDQLTLLEGSVEIMYTKTKEIIKLVPGQTYQADEETINRLQRPPNEFAWKTNTLHFENQLLSKVISDLEIAYAITIDVEDSALLTCKYNGSFANKNLEYILSVIAATLQVSIRKSNNKYLITGKSKCL